MAIIEGCSFHNFGFPGPPGTSGIFIGPPELAMHSRAALTLGIDGDVSIRNTVIMDSGGDGVSILDSDRNHTIDGLRSFANAGDGLSVRAAPPPNRDQRRRMKAQARRGR